MRVTTQSSRAVKSHVPLRVPAANRSEIRKGDDPDSVPAPRNGLGVFGTFFPIPEMAGNSSTGFVAALAGNGMPRSIIVFAQRGAVLPKGELWSKVSLRPCWAHDDPISLLQATRTILTGSNSIDSFFFNIYVTAFGRRATANTVGLLLPPLLALLTRKPVTVYMHNFLETQEASMLGYRPSLIERWGVRILERILLLSAKVVVPLESQKTKISQVFGIVPKTVFVPFVEPFGLIASMGKEPIKSDIPVATPARILLLGGWGPQKDLIGVLEALRLARQRGGQFSVSITGAINPHFPDYRKAVEDIVATMDPTWCHYVGYVPESDLLKVVLDHDLTILPYNATGGYSGAMSVAAYCGIGIISYDLPQMRETAKELGIHPVFVAKGDTPALAEEIILFSSEVRSRREARHCVPNPEFDARLQRKVGELIEIIRCRR